MTWYKANCLHCGDWLFQREEAPCSGWELCGKCGHRNLFIQSTQPLYSDRPVPLLSALFYRILCRVRRHLTLPVVSIVQRLDQLVEGRSEECMRKQKVHCRFCN